MGAPLEGVKIVDFGQYVAGPAAGRMLADLGADVVKVERYGRDPSRILGRPFMAANRGKRGVCIDLRKPAGIDIARRIIAWADVVHHNWRPGVAEKLGLDFEAIKAINPQVIYVESPGYGKHGPYSKLPALEPLVSERAGIMFYGAGPDDPPMRRVGANMDWGNSTLGAAGIIMALLHRKWTGQAQRVECAEYAASVFSLGEVFLDAEGNRLGEFRSPDDGLSLGDPLVRLYEASDGWLCIACRTAADWDALARTIPALATDARFATEDGRRADADALAATLTAAFATDTVATWMARLDAAGVPAERSAPDFTWHLLHDQRYLDSGHIVEQVHPLYGTMREVGTIFHLSDTPSRHGGRGPLYGEHNRDFLGELGYVDSEIDAFEESGVLASDPPPVAASR